VLETVLETVLAMAAPRIGLGLQRVNHCPGPERSFD
jgi:hypothetical protein